MARGSVEEFNEVATPSRTAAAGRSLLYVKSDGKIYVKQSAVEVAHATEKYVQSRGMNLVTNGSGLLGNNYNFEGSASLSNQTTFVVNDRPLGAAGSFQFNSNASTWFSTEFIPVDPAKMYAFQFTAKQLNSANTTGRLYAMLAPFDISGLSVLPQHYMYQLNTTTTLASALTNGDTTVTLTSAANWANAAGASTHHRSIIFWNYVDPTGYAWPVNTYSRNFSGFNIYADGAINDNVITLTSPWAGGSYAAGTSVSNGSSGGGYMYLGASNTIIPNVWTTYSAEAGGGVHSASASAATTQFPWGTASVKIGTLPNRAANGSYDVGPPASQHAIANVSLSEVAAYNLRNGTINVAKLQAGAIPTGVTIPATQVTAGALPSGVTVTPTQAGIGAAPTTDLAGTWLLPQVARVRAYDTRAVNDAPTAYVNALRLDFKQGSTIGLPAGSYSTYAGVMFFRTWNGTTGDRAQQVAYTDSGHVYRRYAADNLNWNAWVKIADVSNDNIFEGDTRLTNTRTPTAHVHSGADVTTGTLDSARLDQRLGNYTYLKPVTDPSTIVYNGWYHVTTTTNGPGPTSYSLMHVGMDSSYRSQIAYGWISNQMWRRSQNGPGQAYSAWTEITSGGSATTDASLLTSGLLSDDRLNATIARQTAVDAKADIASPTFTGTVVVPAASGTTSPYQKGQVDTLLAGKTDTGHVHSAATDLTGTLADARLPQRLSASPTHITDWNTATESGFYTNAASAANAPTAQSGYGYVYAWSSTYLVQNWMGTSTEGPWQRKMTNGVWTDWYEVMVYKEDAQFSGTINLLTHHSVWPGQPWEGTEVYAKTDGEIYKTSSVDGVEVKISNVLDNAELTGTPWVMGPLKFTQVAAPTAPLAGTQLLYAKSDGDLYKKDSSNREKQIAYAPLFARTTTNVTDNTNTQIFPGLSLNVLAGKTYRIKAAGQFASANVGNGIAFRLQGTCTASSVRYQGSTMGGAAANRNHWNASSVAAPAYDYSAGVTVANTPYNWFIDGVIVVDAAGTLVVTFASETNGTNVTVYANSFLELMEVA